MGTAQAGPDSAPQVGYTPPRASAAPRRRYFDGWSTLENSSSGIQVLNRAASQSVESLPSWGEAGAEQVPGSPVCTVRDRLHTSVRRFSDRRSREVSPRQQTPCQPLGLEASSLRSRRRPLRVLPVRSEGRRSSPAAPVPPAARV